MTKKEIDRYEKYLLTHRQLLEKIDREMTRLWNDDSLSREALKYLGYILLNKP